MERARKELKALSRIEECWYDDPYTDREDNLTYKDDIDTIKQAITTKSEKEQALEIIVKKDVDIEYLKTCIYSSGFIDIEEYNGYVDSDKELTREEINLVSKVVKEITENE